VYLYTIGVGPAMLTSLAVCSLAFSAGPGRGLAIVGKRRARLLLAALSAVYGYPWVVTLVDPYAPVSSRAFAFLGVPAIVVAVAVTRVSGAVGGRVAVLVAAGPLADLVSSLSSTNDVTVTVVVVLSNVVLAVLVWPVAIASWKGRVSRA
jgi:hypothetical protein